jgi:hypothetical protein
MLSFRYNFVNIASHVYIMNSLKIKDLIEESKTKGAENSAPFGIIRYI